MDATPAPPPATIDWSEMPVASLVGTELEWSTISPASRGSKWKQKICVLCTKSYTGGPAHIRQHLDGNIKPRNVSVPCLSFSCRLCARQHAACMPLAAWRDRHEEVLAVLRSRAAEIASRETLATQRALAKSTSMSTTCTSPLDASLFMRPSAEQVDEQWARALIRKGLALDLVDEPEFRKAVLMTAKAGLSYARSESADHNDCILPHRTKMTTVCVPRLDDKLNSKVSKRVDGIIDETGARLLSCLVLHIVSRCHDHLGWMDERPSSTHCECSSDHSCRLSIPQVEGHFREHKRCAVHHGLHRRLHPIGWP